jgi:hypothetical protein
MKKSLIRPYEGYKCCVAITSTGTTAFATAKAVVPPTKIVVCNSLIADLGGKR